MAISSSATNHYANLLIFAGLWCMFVGYLLSIPYFEESGWDECYQDRFQLSYKKNANSHLVMYFTEVFVFIITFMLATWNSNVNDEKDEEKKEKGLRAFFNFPLAYDCCYTILWFIATYLVVVFLKDLLDDSLCNTKPNSVSGHTCYFIFYILNLYYMGMYRTPPEDVEKPSWRRHMFNICFIIVLVLAIVNLSNTYTGGYHTPRQMIYGGLTGLLSHILSITTMIKPSSRRNSKLK